MEQGGRRGEARAWQGEASHGPGGQWGAPRVCWWAGPWREIGPHAHSPAAAAAAGAACWQPDPKRALKRLQRAGRRRLVDVPLLRLPRSRRPGAQGAAGRAAREPPPPGRPRTAPPEQRPPPHPCRCLRPEAPAARDGALQWKGRCAAGGMKSLSIPPGAAHASKVAPLPPRRCVDQSGPAMSVALRY